MTARDRLAIRFGGLSSLSGTCGLTYGMVWSRLLSEVFGVTALAASTVLASLLGGIALGALLFGRRADRTERPLRMFAVTRRHDHRYCQVYD